MWSKRPVKNRRLGREFVLDVKLRSSQVRAARVRMAAIALGSLFTAVAVLYVAWRAGEWTLNVLLYENKAFAIQEIDVQTDGVIALDQIRRWTGVRPGQNVFALDLMGVRRNLEMVSWIRTVSLEKVLPRTLRIRVVEREPLAQLSVARPRATGGIELVAFYLDEEGYVIAPLSPAQCSAAAANQPTDQLPLIVGLNAVEIQPGRRIELPHARAALQLIQAFERSPMQALADLSRIDVSMADVLIVKTGQGGEITFGLTGIDQQLLRWQAAFESGLGMNKAIATLDLAVSNNVPATWLEASTVSSPSAKLPKSLRTRKKHV
jgi:cell division septal protein FtsQ